MAGNRSIEMSIYDYIIIGAGSAGCAIAARLSETGQNKILVIEAGPSDEDQELVHVPARFTDTFETKIDWNFWTVEQLGANGRRLHTPRGKVFGGSSSINAMVYQRGAPSNYDGWCTGNIQGWAWKDVLPYFIKSENNERLSGPFHGKDGPLNVTDLVEPNPLSKALLAAAEEQGYAVNSDFNDGRQEGFGLYQVTQLNGRRFSAADAYLREATSRCNVDVLSGALTRRLIIEGGSCHGVVFEVDGREYIVEAQREVVLSAGAYGSPQILMLSGIGPRAHLESLGIEVQLDLPGVGSNLQDHYLAPVAYHDLAGVSLAGIDDPAEVEKFANGHGMLTSNGAEAGGFLTVLPDASAPDLQFHFVPGFSMKQDALRPEGHGFTLHAGVVGTKSRGTLSLASSDPLEKPLIDPGCFIDERDLEVMLVGLKIARKLLRSTAFDTFRGEEVLPGPEVQSDDALRDYLREYVETIYHPVGTCKMGADEMAVVDETLQVHGIKGLRVADASIMPNIINANTNAPSMMIGEKCAAMIKAGW